uniref:Broad-complex core protein n=1 Tax=Lygus hesperus TaxID=30085 RepID=A0A0K8TAL0_LYGHE
MGTNQQFSLRWNNYVNHITQMFDTLREDENLVDVTLCCEGKKLRAHKMLLSACSTYFREIFQDNPCQHPVIIFRNVKFEDLEALVSFMYKGEVKVEQDGLVSFLSTAELLEVKGLTGSGQCFPDAGGDEEDCYGTETLNKRQGSPKSSKPDSPGSGGASKNRKWADDSPPPLTSLKGTDPSEYLEQDLEDMPDPPDFPDLKIETGESGSWGNEDNIDGQNLTSDGLNDLGHMAGTSADGNLQESLQVFAHGLWRRLHPSLKRFGCDECGKVFKHPRSLDHHKKMHEGRTTCPFCRRVFGRMYALRLHMSSSHPGQPMLQSTKSH